ncbi:hypothetical protein HSR122_1526 [Halapricum desulfuricans]|uniref:Uncharacterized protein n=1 Tax=Halapricum desulfuricans TaxID=2841257 RepID=A0A897N9E1_9EURY|nr:hypothetical protein HSR122_1526 [Halapricum desulfuricans]
MLCSDLGNGNIASRDGHDGPVVRLDDTGWSGGPPKYREAY